ncbi:HEPN domain-containing protein [Pedobacter agri]|uniref:HEPN domain-containing protein n=1 Tax=Pedobacter agri TaxID=454586 RepID=UPI0029305861|nr:HEPN domain-containing protein [Pedobacter agri]
MKTSVLSSTIEHELYFSEFIRKLSEKFQPLQIFSFFKHSSSQKQSSCFVQKQNSSIYDYCLLVVTETATRIDYEVQDFANRTYEQGSMTIICHNNQLIWEAIDLNSRFFKTIYNYGELLYSHCGLLTRPYVGPFIQVDGAKKAVKHYRYRMPLAEGFLSGADKCLQEERWELCLFMLHQAVEQTSIMLIRVLLSYRSEFHNLCRLLKLLRSATDQPYLLFFETAESRRLFDILCKSYSSARYKPDFAVKKIDAGKLYHMVTDYLSMANNLCDRHIDCLNQAETGKPCIDPNLYD